MILSLSALQFIFLMGRNLIFNRTVSSNINQVRFSVPKSDIYYINASLLMLSVILM